MASFVLATQYTLETVISTEMIGSVRNMPKIFGDTIGSMKMAPPLLCAELLTKISFAPGSMWKVDMYRYIAPPQTIAELLIQVKFAPDAM